jgi:hypothetical protein
MKRLMCVVLAVVCLWSAAAAPGQDGDGQSKDQALKAFHSAVERSDLYRMARTFDVRSCESAAQRWGKTLEVKIQLQTQSFLEAAEKTRFPAEDGKLYSIVRREDLGGTATWVLRVVKGQQEREHLLGLEDLGQLRFAYVSWFLAADPANRRHETLSFDSVNVVKAIEQLCRLGDIDWAFRSRESQTKINLRLRNKSVVEALSYLATAAGWKVQFQRTGVSGLLPQKVGDWQVMQKSAVKDMMLPVEAFWKQRMETDPVGRDDALDAFGVKFSEQVKQMLSHRPVAVFEAPGDARGQGLIVPLE